MNSSPVEREAILPRIDGIQRNIKKLEELAKLPFEHFSTGDPYDLAQHHLRLALEGIFHISSHILSRIPGARAVEYKEVARKMGEHQLVPLEFAERVLIPMAGMRNILVHHYSDMDPQKLYDIVKNHRRDIEQFLQHIKTFLENPKKLGLTVT